MRIIKGKTSDWELVIGLEVHAQVSSESKLFSGAATQYGAEPNTQVAFLDAGLPGTLPVINEQCVRHAIKTGLGLKAEINLHSVFDRKNYFYPDLPLGYQISQFHEPIVGKGTIEIETADGTREIGVTRIHLEQDAGKSMHDQNPTSSFVDLNRAGIALMEIVSEPDLRSSEEAGEYMKKLRKILRYLGTCDGDMEKGSLRCDANVSVRKPGAEYGTRCEIKNLNSIKNIIKAIEHEAYRQVEIIEAGGTIDQETRLYDADLDETRTMRSKEDAHDYRYFPDPDLLPLVLDQEYVDKIKQELPELPDDKKHRYIESMELSAYDADILASDKDIAAFFEEVAKTHNPKLTANILTSELFSHLNKCNLSINDSPVNTEKFAELIELINNETISKKIAKQVLELMFEQGDKYPKQIVEEQGLVQVTDENEIQNIIKEILESNTDKVDQYKSGKDKLFGFFVGQVMKATGGKANPQIVNKLLKEKLAA